MRIVEAVARSLAATLVVVTGLSGAAIAHRSGDVRPEPDGGPGALLPGLVDDAVRRAAVRGAQPGRSRRCDARQRSGRAGLAGAAGKGGVDEPRGHARLHARSPGSCRWPACRRVRKQKSKAYALLNRPFGLTLAYTKAVASEANGAFVPPETRPTPFHKDEKGVWLEGPVSGAVGLCHVPRGSR